MDGYPPTVLNQSCAPGSRGRYLKITKGGPDPFVLCEVRVFGVRFDSKGIYSGNKITLYFIIIFYPKTTIS